ncbi:MAG: LytTR family DNA-binding domain-containing protein [Paraglaciecola sp.]|uniref:LytR/AlgR family response regulator transcription factor n=1 Tax=Paraglaciecola sp. TaxID=1920173 RepID=UPI003299B6D7
MANTNVAREQRKFNLSKITLIEAYGNYVKVWQKEKMTLVNSTLKQCFQQLPQPQFVQIHKSFLVNKLHVTAIDKEHVHLAEGKTIKVGKSFKGYVQELL